MRSFKPVVSDCDFRVLVKKIIGIVVEVVCREFGEATLWLKDLRSLPSRDTVLLLWFD